MGKPWFSFCFESLVLFIPLLKCNMYDIKFLPTPILLMLDTVIVYDQSLGYQTLWHRIRVTSHFQGTFSFLKWNFVLQRPYWVKHIHIKKEITLYPFCSFLFFKELQPFQCESDTCEVIQMKTGSKELKQECTWVEFSTFQ